MGSSPLTRGKPERRGRWQCRHRLIPAHAGKTGCPSTGACQGRAHPRSRGENTKTLSLSATLFGSSPLTRGKRVAPPAPPISPGLIPAHAGKTAGSRTRAGAWRAHPRSRGENFLIVEVAEKLDGSSPLTRGKPSVPPEALIVAGLIPAHAGKTSLLRVSGTTREAHPRSRGENEVMCLLEMLNQGSSPLTRGKLDAQLSAARVAGLIPAHAGKTRPCSSRHRTRRAHPRSRGENGGANRRGSTSAGSSPLTRGKPRPASPTVNCTGLIPAHAGKT